MDKLLEELKELNKIDWNEINPRSDEELKLFERYEALKIISMYVNQPDKLIWYLSLIWERGYHMGKDGFTAENLNPYK